MQATRQSHPGDCGGACPGTPSAAVPRSEEDAAPGAVRAGPEARPASSERPPLPPPGDGPAPRPPAAPSPCRPRLTAFLLAAADLAALSLCGLVAVVGYRWLRGQYDPAFYLRLWPCLFLFILAYDLVGLYHGVALYPGAGLGPAEELRRGTIATTTCYLLLAAVTFLSKTSTHYSRAVFLIAWALSVVLLPSLRAALRAWLARRPWWGAACVLFGQGEALQQVLRVLQRHPEYGLKAYAVVTREPLPASAPLPLAGVWEMPPAEAAPRLARAGATYAIAVAPSLARHDLLALIETIGTSFQHILVVPGLLGGAAVWASSRCIETVLGFEVCQNLLLPLPRRLKRLVDLLGGLALLALAAPLILILALAIRLTSRGPAFYSQNRLGWKGRPFRMWKFRTMVSTADAVLADYLAHHPEARAEWQRSHKLRHDPRVTPVGRILRRFSLDELPQLWNVLRGDMSLVGPRPIVDAEVAAYGETVSLYTRVRPGLTGLWQISGRNAIAFDERVELDAFYVRNWSVWLDLFILLRTGRAILGAEGAY